VHGRLVDVGFSFILFFTTSSYRFHRPPAKPAGVIKRTLRDPFAWQTTLSWGAKCGKSEKSEGSGAALKFLILTHGFLSWRLLSVLRTRKSQLVRVRLRIIHDACRRQPVVLNLLPSLRQDSDYFLPSFQLCLRETSSVSTADEPA